MSDYRKELINNPIAVLVIAILSIPLGLFFIFSQAENKPIPREEAVAYTGYFDRYDTYSENYRIIYFQDGSSYEVYPHTESREFRDRMKALEKGTELSLLINPNNSYVVEVKTATEELLDFETSQQEIDSYDNGYIAIGIFACACGVLLIIYQISAGAYKKKEKEKQNKKAKDKKTDILRYTDPVAKSRTLLETTVEQYHICYRRVKSVNELVVNGRVYDEKKGIIEFEHNLCAIVDGHSIEAGLDKEDHSYILFDGDLVKHKKRLI